MELEQQLAEFRTEFARTAPPGRSALYEAKIEELRASFAMEQALGVGAEAPDFVLPDARGQPVSLSDILRHGPAVVTFYRGAGAPTAISSFVPISPPFRPSWPLAPPSSPFRRT